MSLHRHITVILDMTRLKAHGIDPTPQVVSEVIQVVSRTAIGAARDALMDAITIKSRQAQKGEEDA